MKVKIPKSYKDLSYDDQQDLKKFTQDVALEAAEKMLERDSRIMLDIYMKMVCLVLHDNFGFGEKRLRMFIGGHKRLFNRQVKLVQRGDIILLIRQPPQGTEVISCKMKLYFNIKKTLQSQLGHFVLE